MLDDKQATDKKDAVNRQLLWYFALANRLIYHFDWRAPICYGGCRDDAPVYGIYIVPIQRWWRQGRFWQVEERRRARWERWGALCISWATEALGL